MPADFDRSEVIKVSIMTSLSQPVNLSPLYVHMRQGGQSNKQLDFLSFVVDCVQSGWLVNGDVLVLDNARIHKAYPIVTPLHMLMQAAALWFLPTYSPELNPCEFVFAQSKWWLSYHRRMGMPFWYEVARGIAETSHAQMTNCYNKAIWNP